MIQIVDELENMSDSCYGTIMLICRSIEKKMEFKAEDLEKLLPYIELVRQFLHISPEGRRREYRTAAG